MTNDKIRLTLDPATRRKLEAIQAHQSAARARAQADPDRLSSSAFTIAQSWPDRRYDEKHGTITVRDYRVLG